MKRVLCLILAVLLALPLFACGKQNGPESNTTGQESKDPDAGTGEEDYLASLEAYDGKQRDFRILVTQQLVEFYDQENSSGDLVDNACFERNAAIEDLFNINLTYTNLDGNASGADIFSKEIRTTTLGGRETGYDLIIGQNYYTLPLVSEDMYHNLMDSTKLNWEADWYHRDINNNGLINNHLYGASGAFIISQLAYAMACFYSKTVYQNSGYDYDLYELVREKKWTWDVYFELATSFEASFSPDSPANTYGTIRYDHAINGLVIGMGVDFVTKDEDGQWTTDDFYTSKVEDVYEKLRSLYNDYSSVMETSKMPYDRSSIMAHTLFCPTLVHALVSDELLMKSDSFKIGVLPLPLYDENQADYRVRVMRDELFLIPVTAELDVSALVTEALNYATYATVNGAYWDKALELRSSDTLQDKEMLSLIASHVYFGTAQYFNEDLVRFSSQMGLEVLNNSKSFSGWWGRNKNVIKRQLGKIVSVYGKTDD